LIAAPGGNARSSQLRRRPLSHFLPHGSDSHSMLMELRESLRGGASLDEAMHAHPSWFDETEVAMVKAAQYAGNLTVTLSRLAEQHQRAGQLGHRLASALAYPC